jgi:hypothetical protein
MANGSKCFALYYLVQIFVYFGVGLAGIIVFFDISEQCKPLCPVAAEDDLAAVGYDRDNPLFNFVAQNGDAPAGTGKAPRQYTYYYACNMTAAMGTPNWWNKSGEAAKYKVWETAVKQSASPSFLGANAYFRWENATSGLWENSKENSRTITLRDGTEYYVKSKCYMCCDPQHMEMNNVCKPDVRGSAVYTWCATASMCASGLMPVPSFPTPPDISLRSLANLNMLLVGCSYITQSILCMLIYCGLAVYGGKYEEDFNIPNLSTSERIWGLFAKRLPLFNRILNTLTIGMIVLGVLVALSNEVCVEAHDQFGQKTYYPTLETFTITVLTIFCCTCVGGTIFRLRFTQDTAFLLPDLAPDDDVFGKTCGELCCQEGRPVAAIVRFWRWFVILWCKFGP